MGKEDKHQLHVDIPEEDWQKLNKILPEKGQVSMIVRHLIRHYIKDVEENEVHPLGMMIKRGGE